MSEQIKKSNEVLRISDNQLIQSVYEYRKKRQKRINIEGENIVAEREVERHYLPARLLNEEDLLEMQGGFSRYIEQRYVWAAKSSDAEAGQKKLVRFRLRKTRVAAREARVEEEAFRIAYKRNSKKNPNAHAEVQRVIDANDPAAAKDQQALLQLWKQGESEGIMTRFYIPYSFTRYVEKRRGLVKKECTCEIHYEIRRTPPHLAGFVRIEVEFQSDEDEAYARDNKGVLPDWIGTDVTDDARYKSPALQSVGVPEEAKQLMIQLRGAR